MKFTINREALLKPLKLVIGVIERRQTLPVLSNVLIVVRSDQLFLTATNLEVELIGSVTLDDIAEGGKITAPAKKLMDICKSLPKCALIEFSIENQKLQLKSKRSRFTLLTLPANTFPNIEEEINVITFTIKQSFLRRLIDKTSFAMAQQDVRYYLNGMLLEVNNNNLKCVATDGHRLAMYSVNANINQENTSQIIVPRKGILAMVRFLTEVDEMVHVMIGKNHIRAKTSNYMFTSKLIDGKFPDYERIIHRGDDHIMIGNRQELRHAFQRASILSNEKYPSIRLNLSDGRLQIMANNQEQEEAEEEIYVDYHGTNIEIGFNVSYLLDVLSVISSESVKLTVLDPNSSVLLEECNTSDSIYVVMPIRL